MHGTFVHPPTDPQRSPDSRPGSAHSACSVLSHSLPHIVYVEAYSAVPGLLRDTGDTPASFLRSSPHASAALGSSGTHNGCGLGQSPESVAEGQSSGSWVLWYRKVETG